MIKENLFNKRVLNELKLENEFIYKAASMK
jgi:hypothetical protein